MVLGLFVLILIALSFLFWLWMLIDCLTHEPKYGDERLIWVLVIIFTQIIGALIYFFVRRPRRWAEVQQMHARQVRRYN